MKTDADGNPVWQKIYGGVINESSAGVIQNADGTYTLGAETSSFGAGSNDIWVLKTDTEGVLQPNDLGITIQVSNLPLSTTATDISTSISSLTENDLMPTVSDANLTTRQQTP
jgi:hypothetical protein